MQNWNNLGENVELGNYQAALWREAAEDNVSRASIRWYLLLRRTCYLVQFFEANYGEIVKYAICLHFITVENHREIRWLLFSCFSHHHKCPKRKTSISIWKKMLYWKDILEMEFYWNSLRKVFILIDFPAGMKSRYL